MANCVQTTSYSALFWNNLLQPTLKPLDTLWTDNNLTVHRFTQNLQGLGKVLVKHFSWNIIPLNYLFLEKTLKHLSINRYRELRMYFKHMSYHGETCGNKAGFSRYFLPTPLTDSASIFTCLLFYIKVVIHEVWAFRQYYLPKGSNRFKLPNRRRSLNRCYCNYDMRIIMLLSYVNGAWMEASTQRSNSINYGGWSNNNNNGNIYKALYALTTPKRCNKKKKY